VRILHFDPSQRSTSVRPPKPTAMQLKELVHVIFASSTSPMSVGFGL